MFFPRNNNRIYSTLKTNVKHIRSAKQMNEQDKLVDPMLYEQMQKKQNYRVSDSLFDLVDPIIQDYDNVMGTIVPMLQKHQMNTITAQTEALKFNKENILQTSDLSISLIQEIDLKLPDKDILNINQQIKKIQELETQLNKVELEFKQEIQQDRTLDQKMIEKLQALKNEILEKIDKVQDSLNNYINSYQKQNQTNQKIQLFKMQQTLLTYLSKHIKTTIVKSKQFEQQYYKSQETLKIFRNDFENFQEQIKFKLISYEKNLMTAQMKSHYIKQQQQEIYDIEKKIVQLFEGLEQKTQPSMQEQLQNIEILKQDLQETENKYQQLMNSAKGRIPENFNTLVLTFFKIQENEFQLQHQMLLKQQQQMTVNSPKLPPLPKIPPQPKITAHKSWGPISIIHK